MSYVSTVTWFTGNLKDTNATTLSKTWVVWAGISWPADAKTQLFLIPWPKYYSMKVCNEFPGATQISFYCPRNDMFSIISLLPCRLSWPDWKEMQIRQVCSVIARHHPIFLLLKLCLFPLGEKNLPFWCAIDRKDFPRRWKFSQWYWSRWCYHGGQIVLESVSCWD